MLAAPARVAILATLADGEPWLFADLRDETGLADGNLHVQTRKLQDSGYIRAEKVNPKGRRVTRFQISRSGHEALTAYLALLGDVFQRHDQAPVEEAAKSPVPKDDDSRVW